MVENTKTLIKDVKKPRLKWVDSRSAKSVLGFGVFNLVPGVDVFVRVEEV